MDSAEIQDDVPDLSKKYEAKRKPRKVSISEDMNTDISKLLNTASERDGKKGRSPQTTRTQFGDGTSDDPEKKLLLAVGPEEETANVGRRRHGSDGQIKFGGHGQQDGALKDDNAKTRNNRNTDEANGFETPGTFPESTTKSATLSRKKSWDHTPHEIFVELDQLTLSTDWGWTWQEKARWIKFEEDVEEGAERWGKPHVASLSFHSLLELRKCLEHGVILLDQEDTDFAAIVSNLVHQFVEMGQLNPEKQGQVMKALMFKHRHVGASNFTGKPQQPKQSARRRSSPAVIALAAQQSSAQSSLGRAGSRRVTSPAINVQGLGGTGSMTQTFLDLENQVNGNSTGEDAAEEPEVTFPGRRKSVAVELIQNLAQKTMATVNPILKRIPLESEGVAILVGSLDYLTEITVGFVRLSEGQLLDGLLEVPIPVRFVFIILGPEVHEMNHYEVGRSVATLMTNKLFRCIAYQADDRQDFMDAINEFLSNSIVLPPGKLDGDTLLPIMHKAMTQAREPIIASHDKEPLLPSEKPVDPLKRTKRLFGGVINDVKRRYPHYLSDFKDALCVQCIAAFFFIYFACLAPAITFGGLLGESTNKLIGVSEMLVGTCVGGILVALLAGQPLVIVGFTGPILVFEEALFQICRSVDLDYLSFRVWIGFWITIIGVFFVMFEGSFLVRFVTRFLEEIFSSLISLIFIYEVFRKLYLIFKRHPLLPYYPECPLNTTEGTSYDGNGTLLWRADYMPWMASHINGSDGVPPGVTSIDEKPAQQPNTALLCLILTFGTFIIAYSLKFFRNGKFLGRSIRRAIGDFGIPIAIVLMVLVDVLIKDTYTEKLDVPESGFSPTAPQRRGWFINPLGVEKALPVWAFFLALLPALLVSILMFMETLIASMIVNKKDRKLTKGSGYHLDLLLISLLASFSGLLGLPMLCVATVRSVTHVSALSVFSRTHAPGEKPKLVKVLEQRVTGLAVHVMIGVSVMMGPALRQVPLAVLFGVFLYMGIASMSGIQLFQRIKFLLMPVKHHSHVGFVRRVRTWKMHLFTFIQLLCLAVLWAVKSTQAALAFPFFLILLVPVRLKLLKYIFTAKEIFHLDRADAESESYEDEPDFYEQSRIPE